jgi:hypothetical protein
MPLVHSQTSATGCSAPASELCGGMNPCTGSDQSRRLAFPFGSIGTLVAAVPHLMRFHPENSLVYVVLKGWSTQVRVAARLDLPDDAGEPTSVHEQWWSTVVSVAERVIQPGDLVYVLVFSSTAQTLAIAEYEQILDSLTSHGASVGESVWVHDRRWTCLGCARTNIKRQTIQRQSSTCPPMGWPVTAQDRRRAKVLVGSVHGQPVRRSRADLEAELRIRRPMLRTRKDPMTSQVREIAVAHAMDYLTAPTLRTRAKSDQELLVSSIIDLRVRDTLVWDLVHAGPEAWKLAQVRLTTLVVHTGGEARAATATILAIMRWQLGDGAGAHIALDAALAANPEYRLARLLRDAVDSGMPPQYWRKGFAHMSRASCLGEGNPAA